jgi:hypothetical protein
MPSTMVPPITLPFTGIEQDPRLWAGLSVAFLGLGALITLAVRKR